MSDITDTEFEAALKLNADYREGFFLNKIKELNGLYVVIDSDGGPYVFSDDEEDEDGNKADILPVFYGERFAEHFIKINNLESCSVKFIGSDVYTKAWDNLLTENNILLGVMPIVDEFNVIEANTLFK